MDAPLGRRLRVDGRGLSEGDVQVLVARDGALRGAGDDLMEINVVRKVLQRRADLARRSHLQCRAEMEFADPGSVLPKTANDTVRFLELHRQVARVVVHAEMRVEPRIIRPVTAQQVKKTHRLVTGLQVAEWFR